MKLRVKSVLCVALAAATMVGTLASCQGGGETTSSAPSTPASQTGSEKPYEGVTLKYAQTQSGTTGDEIEKVRDLVKEETGATIEWHIVADRVDGEIDKTLVDLMNGTEIDMFYEAFPNMKKFYNARVLSELTPLAEAAGYDMEAIHGTYLDTMADGKVYTLPAFTDIWLTLYNKKIFDDAGVAYPTAEGWTWEKYVETAKQLTDDKPETDPDKIWGSLMLDYNNYNYMIANQKKVSHYNEDQTATNYDDPAFADGLKFFVELGTVEKIQPTISYYKSSNTPWDGFATEGRYGMFVCGGWSMASLMGDKEKYPRDWKFGLLPMPYPEGQDPTVLTVPGCYAVPTTSGNKDAAFAAISTIAMYQYTLGAGRVPARVDLSDEEINEYIENELVTPFVDDGVTVEDIKAAWFDPNREAVPEKVIGPGDAEINSIWVEEAQLYELGEQDLETTMNNLKTRGDEAIANDSGM